MVISKMNTHILTEEGPGDTTPLNSPIEGQAATFRKTQSTTPAMESKMKGLEEIIGTGRKLPATIQVEVDSNKEIMDLGGVPEDHREGRRAKIYKPARNAMQSGWENVGVWKIDLDNRERWENPNIGWCSSADPLSNISMQLNFASMDDAVNFCEKNRWSYEICEPQEREIKPKAYGANFSWNKRTRVSTK